jgi:ribosomal-protein-alanine N-acetyltransferase
MTVRTSPINTQRLLLRQFVEADAPIAYENWMSDRDVTEFLTWNAHRGPHESLRIIRCWVRAYDQGTMDWCITLKPSLEPIGSITAVQDFPDERYCEMGYCIAKDQWNKGLMTEAVKAVVGYIFRNTDYLWIRARYDRENEASGRTLLKCNFKKTGEEDLPDPKNRDEIRRYVMMRIDRSDVLLF